MQMQMQVSYSISPPPFRSSEPSNSYAQSSHCKKKGKYNLASSLQASQEEVVVVEQRNVGALPPGIVEAG